MTANSTRCLHRHTLFFIRNTDRLTSRRRAAVLCAAPRASANAAASRRIPAKVFTVQHRGRLADPPFTAPRFAGATRAHTPFACAAAALATRPPARQAPSPAMPRCLERPAAAAAITHRASPRPTLAVALPGRSSATRVDTAHRSLSAHSRSCNTCAGPATVLTPSQAFHAPAQATPTGLPDKLVRGDRAAASHIASTCDSSVPEPRIWPRAPLAGWQRMPVAPASLTPRAEHTALKLHTPHLCSIWPQLSCKPTSRTRVHETDAPTPAQTPSHALALFLVDILLCDC